MSVDIQAKIVSVSVPNDGIMEEETNAYIIGRDPVVVIDPGSAAGTETILAALAQRGNPTVRDIILTHAHPDHAAGAAALRERTGAPVWLHPAELPVAERMSLAIPVDHNLVEGQVLEIDGLRFEAILTPGHAPGHIIFVEHETRTTIAGDMVHGRGTVGIWPPYGRMGDYLDSLQRMLDHGVTELLPGHGPRIVDGPARLRRYIEHRLAREAQIFSCVMEGLETIPQLLEQLYPDVAPQHQHAAAATLRAHLEKLIDEGRVATIGTGRETRYYVAE